MTEKETINRQYQEWLQGAMYVLWNTLHNPANDETQREVARSNFLAGLRKAREVKKEINVLIDVFNSTPTDDPG